MAKKKSRTSSGTKYGAILEAMGKLRKGQAYTAKRPKGVDIRTFHNRLNAALKRAEGKPSEPKPAKGCAFFKSTTDKNDILIECLPYE